MCSLRRRVDFHKTSTLAPSFFSPSAQEAAVPADTKVFMGYESEVSSCLPELFPSRRMRRSAGAVWCWCRLRRDQGLQLTTMGERGGDFFFQPHHCVFTSPRAYKSHQTNMGCDRILSNSGSWQSEVPPPINIVLKRAW